MKHRSAIRATSFPNSSSIYEFANDLTEEARRTELHDSEIKYLAGITIGTFNDIEVPASPEDSAASLVRYYLSAVAHQKTDWTIADGRSNSSPLFVALCEEIEKTIRGGAYSLIAGDAGSVARVILAQLAHTHGLRPMKP